jgi:glycosyltransferase involved in cell wall biosynthesis
VTVVPRVVHNDWSSVSVAELGRWRPRLTVSVVIPAYNCQASLDLTLASLSRQTYPASLLEVIVVDDGSRPRLVLPEIRPDNCRLVWAPDHAAGWGIAHASEVGARQSSGEIIQRLDADMVVYPDHIEAHARWHHELPYAVTLGAKRFVDVGPGGPGWPSPATVAGISSLDDLFAAERSEPHDYIETMIRRTDQLRAGDHLTFLAHVGATVGLRRELYDAAGGFDRRLRRGSDTEFGYRLAQVGAVFVPEPAARSWHLGPSNMMRDEERLQRYSRPFLADLMPHPRWLRKTGGSAWAVPLVEAVMDVRGRSLELVRAAVDAILRGDETDLRVNLIGDWDALGDERQPTLADPRLDLRLIEATYRSDPRVRFVDRLPSTAFPAPYLLIVPAHAGLARSAVGRLVAEADRNQAGLVRVPVPGDRGEAVELWRTAARGRARWVRRGDEAVEDVVAEVFGSRTLPADAVGVVDLSRFSTEALADGIGAAAEVGGRWLPAAVEVAGLRSWVRATGLVARLSAARGRRIIDGRLRRLIGPGPGRGPAGRRGGASHGG